jgi:signal transduction histidine kinase
LHADLDLPRAEASAVIEFFLQPWRGSTMWRSLAWEALDCPLGLVVGVSITVLVAVSIGLAVTFVIAIPLAWFTFLVAAQFGRIERSRAAALLGVNLASPHAPFAPGNWWSRLRQQVTTASRWREIGYLSLGLPIQAVMGAAVLVLWSAAFALAALPAYVTHLPGQSADLGAFRLHQGLAAAAAAIIGVLILLVVAPQATVALAAMDRRIVRWLLGPRARTDLARRVDELELSRSAAVSSAEAERHRIERDLHDGAQQRLVALAMDLGRARERFDSEPESARRLVNELRNLARGIHPAVLTDRGLDAALSAVIARSPVPVSLVVNVPARPPASVESAAYFVVAEALTNVAKHAQATRVNVSIVLQNNKLVLDIRDDGVGGADSSRGGGISGLADRVHALGGWMRVLSPRGGPTSVMAEIPCGS